MDPRPALLSGLRRALIAALTVFAVTPVCAETTASTALIHSPRPLARSFVVPETRWDARRGATHWTMSTLSAVSATSLVDTVPADVTTWCPGYASKSENERAAFWVGMLSALAHVESRHRPDAVGGGGQYFGLMQISPATARQHGCNARTGEALLDPAANLGCAARILETAVRRDRTIAASGRGAARQWGPLSSSSTVADLAGWTRVQSYCDTLSDHRPLARPADLVIVTR